MSLDHYLTTQPIDEQNALTADEPEGCADCGQCPCDCDARCPGCGKPWPSAEERELGFCWPCRQAELEVA